MDVIRPFGFYCLWAVLVALSVELVSTGHISVFRDLFTTVTGWKVLLANAGLLGATSALWWGILYPKPAFWITACGWLLLALVNLIKAKILGTPLVWSDFYLYQQWHSVSQWISGAEHWGISLLMILLAGSLAGLLWKFSGREAWGWRCMGSVVAAGVVGCTAAWVPLSLTVDFKTQGFMMGLLAMRAYMPTALPAAKTQQLWAAVKQHHGRKKPLLKMIAQRPDIVLIQSEAYWDPRHLPGVQWPRSFESSFQALQHAGMQLHALKVPVVFGNTANTEFEVLTSLPVDLFYPGLVPFANLLQKPLLALPKVLMPLGYDTAGIHPYKSFFWRRKTVYPLLGFQQFLSETSFDTTRVAGIFISDQALVEKIMERLDQGAQPHFIYAVSMQNHAPFHPYRYADQNLKIEAASTLSKKDRLMLESYGWGILKTNQSLIWLLQQLKRRQRPVVVLMFGDHLPWLGENAQTYQRLHYLPAKVDILDLLAQQNRFPFMFQTPLWVWSNVPTFKFVTTNPLPAYALGPWLLSSLHFPMPFVYHWVYQTQQLAMTCQTNAQNPQCRDLPRRKQVHLEWGRGLMFGFERLPERAEAALLGEDLG